MHSHGTEVNYGIKYFPMFKYTDNHTQLFSLAVLFECAATGKQKTHKTKKYPQKNPAGTCPQEFSPKHVPRTLRNTYSSHASPLQIKQTFRNDNCFPEQGKPRNNSFKIGRKQERCQATTKGKSWKTTGGGKGAALKLRENLPKRKN